MAARRRRFVGAVVVLAALGAVWLVWINRGDEDPVDKFCAEFSHLLRVDQLSFDVNPSDDVEARGAMDRTARQFADAAAAAPPEISADVELLAALTEALSDAVAETSSREAFDRAAALIAAQDPFLEHQDAAAQRVSDYVTRNCTAAPG
ncbi:hypothetical protein [Candidatus Poriferisodalis sp.]|uniref:hypothetical protein n=1 Tax=Candidatus Poriferisodalis sp. TaxID=3101277 RepID=UPI003B02BAA4